jgi:ATP-dependent protease Clp ATPase subunit
MTTCSYCGQTQIRDNKLVVGPGASICGECVIEAIRGVMYADSAYEGAMSDVCSFCNTEIKNLKRVAGKNHKFICVQCLPVCIEALLHNNFSEPKVVQFEDT